MPRTPDADYFLNKLPDDGSPIGNISFMAKLGWEHKPDKYWEIRDQLLAENLIGVGRGKGGSVFQIIQADQEEKVQKEIEETITSNISNDYSVESDLYNDFQATLLKNYIKALSKANFISEITAAQGSRSTGGVWTRPDIVVITVDEFQFIPGKVFNIFSFELKHTTGVNIYSVYEAAAHSRFANYSFLCGYLPNGFPETEEYERILRECERLGIGLVIFKDPKDYSTFEFLIDAYRHTPEPSIQETFIRSQIRDPMNIEKLIKFAK